MSAPSFLSLVNLGLCHRLWHRLSKHREKRNECNSKKKRIIDLRKRYEVNDYFQLTKAVSFKVLIEVRFNELQSNRQF